MIRIMLTTVDAGTEFYRAGIRDHTRKVAYVPSRSKTYTVIYEPGLVRAQALGEGAIILFLR